MMAVKLPSITTVVLLSLTSPYSVVWAEAWCSNVHHNGVNFKVDIFLPDFHPFLSIILPFFANTHGHRFLFVSWFQRFCTPININGVRRGMQCIQSV